eukprot:726827-Prymnesium_polylepis.1
MLKLELSTGLHVKVARRPLRVKGGAGSVREDLYFAVDAKGGATEQQLSSRRHVEAREGAR